MRTRKTIARPSGARRKKSPAFQLKLRRAPTQSRGQQTFDRILSITGRLLDDVGADAVTTNLIAQAADINVATLYQYFPNKRAILVRLYEAQSAQRKSAIESAFAGSLAQGKGWSDALNAAIDAVYALRRDEPGSLRLAQAIRSDPALIEYDRRESNEISGWLATQLTDAGALTGSQSRLVARCATEAVRSLLDLCQLDDTLDERLVLQEARRLAAAYLGPYIGGNGSPRARRRSSRG